uniref:THAP domain-containing protein 1 n=1 Tax=Maylandia zebra TaxID=106582 RepID=A0A3P9CDJ0_9CICH
SSRRCDHCCVPLCSASAKFNGILSFHAFPTHSDLRRQWLVNIRRDHFTITSHTRVCCRHFASDQLIEPTTLDGRRRLIKGAVPTLFEWNEIYFFSADCMFYVDALVFKQYPNATGKIQHQILLIRLFYTAFH